MLAIDNDYLATCACIDTILMRNEMLIISYAAKFIAGFYVHRFLCPLQYVKAMM